MKSFTFTLLILFVIGIGQIQAKNLGVIGPIYPITEEDLLDYIHQRLLTLQSQGSQLFLSSYWIQKAKQAVDRPKPVPSLTRTSHYRKTFFDPTFTVTQDLTDHQGHLMAKAGTSFNPLSLISLRKTLLFYDADDPIQIRWVQRKDHHWQKQDKFILVKGSINEQKRRFSRPIYFDQKGRLVRQFAIQHVPARVTQEKLLLKIEEIKP